MSRLATILVLVVAFPVLALDPSEMLDDPALEARARQLDFDIRCVQCQSEAVASSNANWAQDARKMIRERIVAGDSNAEVKAFFVARYGEFVLMDPPKTGSNLLLWLAGPLMAVIAAAAGLMYLRGRQSAAPVADAPLSAEEQARLDEILQREE